MKAEQQRIHATIADPAFYRESGDKVAATNVRIEAIERELAEAYKRGGGAGGGEELKRNVRKACGFHLRNMDFG